MVAEKTKKMPKGVGKRIIESLRNSETEPELDEKVENEPKQTVESFEESLEEELEVTQEKELECIADDDHDDDITKSYVCAPKSSKSNSSQADIDTLLHLISRLPSGVTKQTGALIIRQTMEAMGISMNHVLSNAQSVQETLENSIKNNVNVIEEYRTKIKILEQEIQKFRKKAHELEDIISLFILSEDKKEI